MTNLVSGIITPDPKCASFKVSYNGSEYFSQNNGGIRKIGALSRISEEIFFSDTRVITENFDSFTRIIISKPPHMSAIVDIGKSDCIAFCAEENSFNVHIYNESRLVFRRDDTALKLFSIGVFENGTFTPEKLCDTSDSGIRTFKWESSGKIRAYTAIAADDEDIRGWHVTQTGGILHLESPGASDTLDIKFEKDSVYILRNEQSAMCAHFSEITR